MAVRLLRIIRRIMSERCRRRKSKVNYKALENGSNSDDDFGPSLKKSRLSRQDKDKAKFEKQMKKALEVSKKIKPDTTLVITNQHFDDSEGEDNNGCHSDDESYVADSRSISDNDQSDGEEFGLKQPLLKEAIDKRVKSVKENIISRPSPISHPSPVPHPSPDSSNGVSLTLSSHVIQTKKPFWKPPAKVNCKNRSPLTSRLINSPGGGGMRIGLSRNARVKSLHQNVKIT